MNEFIILIKIVILLVLLYVSWEIYRKVEKNKKLDKELQHYPPERISCIDFSLIYRGYAERTDIPVIVIELANKGYLKIQAESESQDINSKTVIRIQKLKNYDGDNNNERIMFNTLFKNDRIVYVEELNSDDISGITLNKKKIFMSRFPIKFFIILLIAISVILIGADIYVDYYPKYRRGESILYSLYSAEIINYEQANFIYKAIYFGFLLGISAILCLAMRFSYKKILTVIAYATLNIIIFTLLYGNGLTNVQSVVLFLVEVIVFNLILFMFCETKKRTDIGEETYCHIKGFEKFLNKMNKEQLEELLVFDPYYIEKILPYTFIFKNTRRVLNKYEELENAKMPDWYESNFDIEVKDISKCIIDAYLEISIRMTTNRRRY